MAARKGTINGLTESQMKELKKVLTDKRTELRKSIVNRLDRDAEERNLLFSGVSNLVGVRSDVFTVYFRVRTFRRNAITGIWDATDPEYILSDSRYVMLVDRSKVERPDDKPEIVYLQRLPD